MAFKKVSQNISFAQKEHEVLDFWQKSQVFKRSIEQRDSKSNENAYVFYDGPPFATGLPHYGHLVASTIKDVVPRYWTMRGKKVERRFGWDTHGLPVEMETEKRLGISGPTAIREYGVAKFNEACRSGVLKHTKEWRQTITRLGRFVDFDNDYKTMDPSFMESVWWVFGQLWQKDLVYQGFRVMPYSWRLSTPLSNFEANMDYRNVQDPAVTVKMPLKSNVIPHGAQRLNSAESYHEAIDTKKDSPGSGPGAGFLSSSSLRDDSCIRNDSIEHNDCLLVWTTTPWTLPSNLAVAVGSKITYVRAKKAGDNQVYILAKGRLEAVLGKNAEILSEFLGKELVGQSYEPLFNYFKDNKNSFQVVESNHVTTEDGTGLVHMAPAFGQDDYEVCLKNGIDLVDPVNEEGVFDGTVSDFAGQNVKDADPKIIKHLKENGKLLRHDTIQHSYPYCWRSNTPLIYKAVPVWLVSVTKIKEQMVKHNESIHWVPSAVGQKRFGNWLKDAQDWSISRNRFWGTPIPIWICEKCGEKTCISSVASLEEKSGAKVSDLHSHFIDKITFDCQKCTGKMSRIPEVFDCWFDAGSMPYAQNHYPFENKEKFESQYPAQFIAEGLDQTRGWFYTLLVLSTALFDKPPFKNVVVNGLVLAQDGSKMSKSKQNYPDPNLVLEKYGADALRAYLINSPVVRAEPLMFSEVGVREVVRMVMLPIYHAWSFFTQYANIDGWEPKVGMKNAPNIKDRPEIDRWILSKLQSLIDETNKQMEGYFLYKVIPPMIGFIDDLTNWYIRRSRRRFWRNAADKGA
ncbi:isoleucine--tRNA ligase, partial [Sulfobacillus acidophilus]|nr:isoleucine--tRNA ligase [Sulfobacillus acidophilus]